MRWRGFRPRIPAARSTPPPLPAAPGWRASRCREGIETVAGVGGLLGSEPQAGVRRSVHCGKRFLAAAELTHRYHLAVTEAHQRGRMRTRLGSFTHGLGSRDYEGVATRLEEFYLGAPSAAPGAIEQQREDRLSSVTVPVPRLPPEQLDCGVEQRLDGRSRRQPARRQGPCGLGRATRGPSLHLVSRYFDAQPAGRDGLAT